MIMSLLISILQNRLLNYCLNDCFASCGNIVWISFKRMYGKLLPPPPPPLTLAQLLLQHLISTQLCECITHTKKDCSFAEK